MEWGFTGGLRVMTFVIAAFLSPFLLFAVETNRADWWSFKPAAKPAVPAPASTWARNEIDQFILAKRPDIPPASEASRRILLRRVTFDLTGLPPTAAEMSQFLEDRATNAYEKVVQRLLASPRYGERFARSWLDTVHYGESHGYDKDKPRLNAWPYRDFVIRSFNGDKPYSRFIEEQLAGDVLHPDEPDGVIALGFIAAGPWDFVGHVELPITKTDGLIARYNDRDDMVMNAISTFQSLTVHCARCHDHKFDPITQRDYYSLQAVFAGVDRADRPFDADPAVMRERRALKAKLQQLSDERSRLDVAIATAGGEALAAVERRLSQAATNTPDRAAFGYHSEIAPAENLVKWIQVDLGQTQAIDRIVFAGCHDDFNNIGDGFGFPRRFKIEISDDAEFRSGVTVVSDHTTNDVPNPGIAPSEVKVGGRAARHVRFTATKLAPRKDDYIFALAELMVFDGAGRNLAHGSRVAALDSIEAPRRWAKRNLVDGWYPGAETNVAGLAAWRAEREKLLAALPPALTQQRAASEQAARDTAARLASLPKAQMVYAAASDFPSSGTFLPAKHPRPVYLLKRGDVKKPVSEMSPAGIAAVPGVSADFQVADPADEGARRAALAHWLTDTNNLLTRRSIVNRVWAFHFGRGIVETLNDFGRMGATPTHPELLDWLAFWFMENGESLKELHRLIVTSATYRQSSSGAGPAGAALDGQNRLLWRMNRSRLDAEQFHDALLAIAGTLDETMGGPSVQQFWFKDDHSPVYDYARYDWTGPGADRRSIYRFIVRSVPDPFMEALDCPDANTLAPVRNVTTTALQALATFNDAFVLRQCARLAARLEREGGGGDAQIARAFELVLNRAPEEAERKRLAAHARRRGMPGACRILFNSNEFVFVD